MTHLTGSRACVEDASSVHWWKLVSKQLTSPYNGRFAGDTRQLSHYCPLAVLTGDTHTHWQEPVNRYRDVPNGVGKYQHARKDNGWGEAVMAEGAARRSMTARRWQHSNCRLCHPLTFDSISFRSFTAALAGLGASLPLSPCTGKLHSPLPLYNNQLRY